ncbi:MAG: T9SS type A sorting domain-containing protein [Chitinophagaceae bacterium]|nr:MAG: T9SS type A sorting domain-containing protein [Chitinophagaceae bacterium]
MKTTLPLGIASILAFLFICNPIFSQNPYNKVYWTNPDVGIERANFDGTGRETIVSGIFLPSSLVVDIPHNKVYWFRDDTQSIYQSDINGVGSTLIVPGSGNVSNLALDVPNGKLYWTNDISNKIERSNLDGSSRQDVVLNVSTAGSGKALALTIDQMNHKVYWFDDWDYNIKRANLNLTGTEVFYPFTAGYVYQMYADPLSNKLYWGNFEQNIIESQNLDGSNYQVVVNPTAAPSWGPSGIAIDKTVERVFWMDQENLSIKSAMIDGSGTTQTVIPAATSGTPIVSLAIPSSIYSTLPISIVEFKASARDCSIQLDWETADAAQFRGFEVERSINGMNFVNIGTLPYNEGQDKYTFRDESAPDASLVYRLKLVDLDSRYTYSKLVRTEAPCGAATAVSIYPNPVSSEVWVKTRQLIDRIEIINMTGQPVQVIRALNGSSGTIKVTLDAKIPDGMYLIRTTAADGKVTTKQLMKSK